MTLRAAPVRRVLFAGLAGLCAAATPIALAGVSQAAADPTVTLSATSVRPGLPFTVASATSCPSDSGEQTVDIGYTDSDDTFYLLDSLTTDADGSWGPASVSLPVAGVDEDGGWMDDPVAKGTGALQVTCSVAGEEGDDSGEGNDFENASVGTDDNDFDDDAGDDEEPGDDSGDDSMLTQMYADATLKVSGAAPQISMSPATVVPGGTVTVTRGEACASGATGAELTLVDLSSGDVLDDASPAGASWAATTLTLPSDAEPADYALTATCVNDDGDIVSSYDAQPFAAGTVTLSAPACTDKGASTTLGGTYSGEVAVAVGKRDAEPNGKGRLKLAGDGPWKVAVSSATTGATLISKTLTCPKPDYELDVQKAGLSAGGKPQVKVCNTGAKSAEALLQLAPGKKFRTADDATLDAGDCTTLTADRLDKGDSVKGRVLLNAPGKGDDEVVATFVLKRPRR